MEDSPHHSEATSIPDSASTITIPSIVIHEHTWIMAGKLGVKHSIVAKKLSEYLEDPRTVHTTKPPTALY